MNAAQMIEVSIIGYLVCGAFLSMSYFDLFFHLVAITVILKVLVLPGGAGGGARHTRAGARRIPVPYPLRALAPAHAGEWGSRHVRDRGPPPGGRAPGGRALSWPP